MPSSYTTEGLPLVQMEFFHRIRSTLPERVAAVEQDLEQENPFYFSAVRSWIDKDDLNKATPEERKTQHEISRFMYALLRDQARAYDPHARLPHVENGTIDERERFLVRLSERTPLRGMDYTRKSVEVENQVWYLALLELSSALIRQPNLTALVDVDPYYREMWTNIESSHWITHRLFYRNVHLNCNGYDLLRSQAKKDRAKKK